MSATKVLWGQILVVFAIVLVTMWAATQWVAWKLQNGQMDVMLVVERLNDVIDWLCGQGRKGRM